MIVALAGGVGGAKLANGFVHTLSPPDLLIAVNTGDDFTHLGLHISPDLDSVMYRLADVNDSDRGWGVRNETWQFMDMLARFGGETWFNLGDRDLATHVERTRRLASGEALSTVTGGLCRALGIAHHVAPMSDDPVRTVMITEDGPLEFQHWFVRLRSAPRVERIRFDGASDARPTAPFMAALASPALDAIVICPSNPFISIDPILAIPGIRDAIRASGKPVVAVSPVIGGAAVKGPAAKMMGELGLPVSPLGIARHYGEVLSGLVIDEADAPLARDIEAAGVAVLVTGILMRTFEDEARLASETLEFAHSLASS